MSQTELIQKYHSLDIFSIFVLTYKAYILTYKAYILSRIKRAILFDKSKIALKRFITRPKSSKDPFLKNVASNVLVYVLAPFT